MPLRLAIEPQACFRTNKANETPLYGYHAVLASRCLAAFWCRDAASAWLRHLSPYYLELPSSSHAHIFAPSFVGMRWLSATPCGPSLIKATMILIVAMNLSPVTWLFDLWTGWHEHNPSFHVIMISCYIPHVHWS